MLAALQPAKPGAGALRVARINVVPFVVIPQSRYLANFMRCVAIPH